MRITQNPNGSFNLFGLSRAKMQALLRAIALTTTQKLNGEFPTMDFFDMKLCSEVFNDLMSKESEIWK